MSSALEPGSPCVLDASALVDLLLANPEGRVLAEELRDRELHAPAHLDAEVLSALGRLVRGEAIEAAAAEAAIDALAAAPVARHPLAPHLAAAWRERADLRLLDALYIVLARSLGMRVLTTDARLERARPDDCALLDDQRGPPTDRS